MDDNGDAREIGEDGRMMNSGTPQADDESAKAKGMPALPPRRVQAAWVVPTLPLAGTDAQPALNIRAATWRRFWVAVAGLCAGFVLPVSIALVGPARRGDPAIIKAALYFIHKHFLVVLPMIAIVPFACLFVVRRTRWFAIFYLIGATGSILLMAVILAIVYVWWRYFSI